MKGKKLYILIFFSVALCFVLCSCSIFGGGSGGSGNGSKSKLTGDMLNDSPFSQEYEYTGEAIEIPSGIIKITVNGETVNNKYFSFTYKNNVAVGEATVTITATDSNPNCYGSITKTFLIVPGQIYVNNAEELSEKLADDNFGTISIGVDMFLDEDTIVVVPQNKTLEIAAVVTNEGKFINNGAITLGGRYPGSEGTIVNRGTIENNNYFYVDTRGTIYSSGSINNSGDLTLTGNAYVNEAVDNYTERKGGKLVVRQPLNESNLAIEGGDIISYNPKVLEYCPTVATTAAVKYEYKNNTKPGTATIIVTVEETDAGFFGEAELTFVIAKGSVSVKKFSDLVEKQKLGIYGDYTADSLTISDDFTLAEDETLTVGSLVINAQLTNNGKITISAYNTLQISEKAVLSNNGEIKANYSVSLYGKVINLEGGKIEAQQISLAEGASIENAGNIVVEKAGLSGAVTNSGTITFSKKDTETIINDLCEINIKDGGKLVFEGDTCVYCQKFVGNGTVKNTGDMFIDDVFSVGDITFENGGTIWTDNASLALAIGGDVCVRKDLSDESVVVELEYETTPYDGTEKKPGVTIDGVKLTDTAIVSYTAIINGARDFTNAGEVKVVIGPKNWKNAYKGSRTLYYEITKIEKEIASGTELEALLTNGSSDSKNYSKFVLTADCTITYAENSYFLLEDQTLCTNGFCIVLDGARLTNKGVIEVAEKTGAAGALSKDAAAFILQKNGENKTAVLSNYGTIINKGVFYVEEGSALNNERDGSILNDGTLITNDEIDSSGAGTVYARTDIKTLFADEKIKFDLEGISYDGTEKKPVVASFAEDVTLTQDDLEYTYANNIIPGAATVGVKVKNEFNKNYYGNYVVTFIIHRGVATITGDTVRTGAGSVFLDDNYEKLVLSESIVIDDECSLGDDMILDIGDYTLSFGKGGSLTLGNKSKICASPSSLNNFVACMYFADKITLTGDIGQVGGEIEYNFADVTVSNAITGVKNANYSSLEIDMNGYSILSRFELSNSKVDNFSLTFCNSSGDKTKSVIGSVSDTDYGFKQTDSTKKSLVTFNDVTIAGVYAVGGNGGIEITATDCSVKNENTKAAVYFDANGWLNNTETYTNCVIQGKNGIFVYKCKNLTLDNCEVKAVGEFTAATAGNPSDGNAITIVERLGAGSSEVVINGGSLISENGYYLAQYGYSSGSVSKFGTLSYGVGQTTKKSAPKGECKEVLN